METEEPLKPLIKEETGLTENTDELDRFEPRKAAMLQALVKTMGVVMYAAREAGIPRRTHYNWLKEDEDYKDAVNLINDIALDFSEARLFKCVEEDNLRAITFLLRTRGKSRGYSMFKDPLVKQDAIFKIIVKDEAAKKIVEMNRDNP